MNWKVFCKVIVYHNFSRFKYILVGSSQSKADIEGTDNGQEENSK